MKLAHLKFLDEVLNTKGLVFALDKCALASQTREALTDEIANAEAKDAKSAKDAMNLKSND